MMQDITPIFLKCQMFPEMLQLRKRERPKEAAKKTSEQKMGDIPKMHRAYQQHQSALVKQKLCMCVVIINFLQFWGVNIFNTFHF